MHLAEIEVLAPGGNQETVKMCSVKKYLRFFKQLCGVLVPKSPLLIYANHMLPVPTTLLLEMTQADLEQLTA